MESSRLNHLFLLKINRFTPLSLSTVMGVPYRTRTFSICLLQNKPCQYSHFELWRSRQVNKEREDSQQGSSRRRMLHFISSDEWAAVSGVRTDGRRLKSLLSYCSFSTRAPPDLLTPPINQASRRRGENSNPPPPRLHPPAAAE